MSNFSLAEHEITIETILRNLAQSALAYNPVQKGCSAALEPCTSQRWPGFEVTYQFGAATCHVCVDNSAGTGRGARSVTLHGHPVASGRVPLRDDGNTHEVGVLLG